MKEGFIDRVASWLLSFILGLIALCMAITFAFTRMFHTTQRSDKDVITEAIISIDDLEIVHVIVTEYDRIGDGWIMIRTDAETYLTNEKNVVIIQYKPEMFDDTDEEETGPNGEKIYGIVQPRIRNIVYNEGG